MFDFLISMFLVFAFIFLVWVMSYVRTCHSCGELLREIDPDNFPININGEIQAPPNAKYYCPSCKPTRYYGPLKNGKPD
jgi:hypothetical protein